VLAEVPRSDRKSGLSVSTPELGRYDRRCWQAVEDLNAAEELRLERRTIGRALEGDKAAFAELYRAHAPRIFARILMPKLGNREAAEDALAETFRTAFEKLDTFTDRGVSVYFWLARIAANKALDMHRAKGTTGRALASFESLVAPLCEGTPDPSELFDLRADIVSVRRAVSEVMGDLNERYRRAIELRFVEELPREECARVLGVKIGTFDVLLLRALRAFRKEWTLRVGKQTHEP
jgi:RNA polymerase sigma factor (sigma-70 family)